MIIGRVGEAQVQIGTIGQDQVVCRVHDQLGGFMDRTKMRLNMGKLPDGQGLANCRGGLLWMILAGFLAG